MVVIKLVKLFGSRKQVMMIGGVVNLLFKDYYIRNLVVVPIIVNFRDQ